MKTEAHQCRVGSCCTHMFGHVYGKGVEAKLNLKREQVQGCERGVVYGKHTLRRSAAHAAPPPHAAPLPPPRRTTTLGEHRCTVGTLPKNFELFLFNRLTFICHYNFSTICVCLWEMTQGLQAQTCSCFKFSIASIPLFCKHSTNFPLSNLSKCHIFQCCKVASRSMCYYSGNQVFWGNQDLSLNKTNWESTGAQWALCQKF